MSGSAMPLERIRRAPQQTRSQQRVRRLLAAAERILVQEGYEALTTRRIAAKARVPIGTLYQFFPDKHAIVGALAHRYMAESAEMMEELARQAEDVHWSDSVGTLVERFVAMYRAKPGYLALWLGRRLSPDLLQADQENNALLADGLRRILVVQEGLADGEPLRRVCRVAVEAGDALLRLAFSTVADGDPSIIAETKRVLRLYLADIVAGAGSAVGRSGRKPPAKRPREDA